MKMQRALDIINNKPKGFAVGFEWIEGRLLRGDYFPDVHAGETLIPTEWEAWELANQFARATKGKTVNIYVTDDHFNPVPNYKARLIENRQPNDQQET